MKHPSTQLSLFEARGSGDAFAVRVSHRARRLTARVHVGGRVEIVVPRGVGPRAVSDFVRRFTPWIDSKVAALRAAAPSAEPVPATIGLGLTGERFSVGWQPGARRRLAEQDGHVAVVAPDERGARQLLRGWLCGAAARRLGPRLRELAASLALDVERVTIRRQRTRWGSCSSRGTVSLNCALLFQPQDVVRYLMIHELMHLTHMNHSARFWRAVERHEPDYRRLDRELLGGWRAVPGWVFAD